MFAFRYVARNQVSRILEFFILLVPVILSMLFTGGILIVDSIYKTPIIDFGIIGSVVIGLFLLCFIIIFSFWAKTAILPVTLLALHLPDIFVIIYFLQCRNTVNYEHVYHLCINWTIFILHGEEGKKE